MDTRIWQKNLEKIKRIMRPFAIPALGGALFRCDGKEGTLTACGGLSLWLTVSFPVEGDKMEVVLYDVEKFQKASKYFSDQITLSYEEKEREIQISDQSRRCSIKAEHDNVFPLIPQWGKSFTTQIVSAKEMTDMYEEIKYALSRQQGVRESAKNIYYDGVRMIVAGLYQMAQIRCANGKQGEKIMLPPAALEWLKIFGDVPVTLKYDGKLAAFSTESMTLYAKISCNDTIPDFDRFIPKQFSQECDICPAELLKSLDFISSVEKNFKNKRVILEGDKLYMDGKEKETCATIQNGSFCRTIVQFAFLYNSLKQYKKQKTVRLQLNFKNYIAVLSDGKRRMSLICLIRDTKRRGTDSGV